MKYVDKSLEGIHHSCSPKTSLKKWQLLLQSFSKPSKADFFFFFKISKSKLFCVRTSPKVVFSDNLKNYLLHHQPLMGINFEFLCFKR